MYNPFHFKYFFYLYTVFYLFILFYFLDEGINKINYLLVLEYADNGTLRQYLKKNSSTFKWENQLKFAKEIASAILYLHHNEIIHRDLVSRIDFFIIIHYNCIY